MSIPSPYKMASVWQFFVHFLGWLSEPLKWLSDLQIGYEKVPLNHLVGEFSEKRCFKDGKNEARCFEAAKIDPWKRDKTSTQKIKVFF